jgi:hypothetical protein
MIDERNNKMMRIDLEVTRREYMVLKRFAAANDVPLIDYISNIVRGWVRGQLRGEYSKLFAKMDDLELANLFGDVQKDGKIKTEGTPVVVEKKKIKDKYKK